MAPSFNKDFLCVLVYSAVSTYCFGRYIEDWRDQRVHYILVVAILCVFVVMIAAQSMTLPSFIVVSYKRLFNRSEEQLTTEELESYKIFSLRFIVFLIVGLFLYICRCTFATCQVSLWPDVNLTFIACLFAYLEMSYSVFHITKTAEEEAQSMTDTDETKQQHNVPVAQVLDFADIVVTMITLPELQPLVQWFYSIYVGDHNHKPQFTHHLCNVYERVLRDRQRSNNFNGKLQHLLANVTHPPLWDFMRYCESDGSSFNKDFLCVLVYSAVSTYCFGRYIEDLRDQLVSCASCGRYCLCFRCYDRCPVYDIAFFHCGLIQTAFQSL
uniref:Gustatory receptor n=1 Tax=Ditylenchus dipsaci TaxID=166011 RepID=A0A915ELD1_9BILA